MKKSSVSERVNGRPTVAANRIVEVYNDTGEMTDPLGMYTGRPYEAGPEYNAVSIPRYDTEAVRYCNGKRYMKPDLQGDSNLASHEGISALNGGIGSASHEQPHTHPRYIPLEKVRTEVNERTNMNPEAKNHAHPTQDADDL